ncbi:DUF551 domain-containing protein [Citrobacter freundii]
MTTNNHPAHGPVSLERMHQIREILSKAAAQSDGGNLGYAMADAVKVIDGAIAAFGSEHVALPLPVQHWEELCRQNPDMSIGDAIIRAAWWNHCAAMLRAGNSPVTPDDWIPVSERIPEAHEPVYIFHPDYGVDQGVWYDDQEDAFLWDSDNSRCRAIETVSHWMPMPALPAAPQQEVKS